PPDRRRPAVCGAAYEAGHHRKRPGRIAPQCREVLGGGAVGLRKNDVRVGELFVGRQELPRIDELGAPESVEIGGDDGSGQPFAEAGGHVERGGWTVTEEAYAVQGVVQLAELSVDERTRPASLAATEKSVDCRPMACGNVFERLFVLWRALLRQPRALDELVRDTLERRDDDNGWAAVGRIEDDSSDVTHPIGRRER